ncbi:MAG: glycosyltransferase family 1 protein [Patescibacteria group bacterium]|nr:glycosyltransferase family 1 protein [Patescibacteria group bacterium]MDD5121199.1 glycosyltransferase family 1 protein [Patescibacteria group bacterium]MDD5395882.1 glycosyltransferase family 1 protein [Patescibacteria group bacterium]
MRIGLDARFFGPQGKGIGRYTEKLIESLEKLDQNNEYFIFLTKVGFDLYEPKNKNFHKVLANYPWYSFKEQLLLPRLLNQYHLDLMHFLHFNKPLLYKGKYVVTIHDLTHLKYDPYASTRSPWQYLIKYLLYRLVSKAAIKRAIRIITVSEFVKNEIIKHYKINSNKIFVTYESTFTPAEMLKMENKFQLPAKDSYLLYVGNAYPHKNLEKLVRAFALAPIEQEIILIFVGKIDYFYERLQKLVEELHLTNRVMFAGAVSDENLKSLYQNAIAYVFPSLMEGFGLPGLEAMANDCPVIASRAGSLPEIYGPAAIYFDPNNEKEISEIIKKIVEDENLRAEIKKLGQERVKKYSWDKCAEQTFDIYRSLG